MMCRCGLLLFVIHTDLARFGYTPICYIDSNVTDTPRNLACLLLMMWSSTICLLKGIVRGLGEEFVTGASRTGRGLSAGSSSQPKTWKDLLELIPGKLS